MREEKNTLLPKLLIPEVEAKQKLQDQIEKGYKIVERTIDNYEALTEARKDRDRWSSFNAAFLRGERVKYMAHVAEKIQGP